VTALPACTAGQDHEEDPTLMSEQTRSRAGGPEFPETFPEVFRPLAAAGQAEQESDKPAVHDDEEDRQCPQM
jgi:hypothetical protein